MKFNIQSYRQSVAPSLFFGAYLPNTSQLVGFICALLTPESTLTHHAMTNHVPNSAFVGIHSVCVDDKFRRKGIAVALLKAYTHRLKAEGYEGVKLISHKELIGLYEKAGFELVGLSSVVHGPEPWFEMKIDFDTSKKIEEKENVVEVTPVVVERNPGKPFESFTGMGELLTADSNNAGNLYCPRGECRCLLLKAGVGKWVRGDSNDFEVSFVSFNSRRIRYLISSLSHSYRHYHNQYQCLQNLYPLKVTGQYHLHSHSKI